MSILVSENAEINSLEFSESIENFDLSLLDSVDSESSSTENRLSDFENNSQSIPTSAISKVDSLSKRVSRIEELLGIYQFAFWKVKPDKAVNIITHLCRDNFGWGVSETDFKVVQGLDHRWGVLFQVSSLELKKKILENVENFKAKGFCVASE